MENLNYIISKMNELFEKKPYIFLWSISENDKEYIFSYGGKMEEGIIPQSRMYSYNKISDEIKEFYFNNNKDYYLKMNKIYIRPISFDEAVTDFKNNYLNSEDNFGLELKKVYDLDDCFIFMMYNSLFKFNKYISLNKKTFHYEEERIDNISWMINGKNGIEINK